MDSEGDGGAGRVVGGGKGEVSVCLAESLDKLLAGVCEGVGVRGGEGVGRQMRAEK